MAIKYVDIASGNDSTGDGSWANPYLTIQVCHNNLNAGDTIGVKSAGTIADTSTDRTLTWVNNYERVYYSGPTLVGVLAVGDIIGKPTTSAVGGATSNGTSAEAWTYVQAINNEFITLSGKYYDSRDTGATEDTAGYSLCTPVVSGTSNTTILTATKNINIKGGYSADGVQGGITWFRPNLTLVPNQTTNTSILAGAYTITVDKLNLAHTSVVGGADTYTYSNMNIVNSRGGSSGGTALILSTASHHLVLSGTLKSDNGNGYICQIKPQSSLTDFWSVSHCPQTVAASYHMGATTGTGTTVDLTGVQIRCIGVVSGNTFLANQATLTQDGLTVKWCYNGINTQSNSTVTNCRVWYATNQAFILQGQGANTGEFNDGNIAYNSNIGLYSGYPGNFKNFKAYDCQRGFQVDTNTHGMVLLNPEFHNCVWGVYAGTFGQKPICINPKFYNCGYDFCIQSSGSSYLEINGEHYGTKLGVVLLYQTTVATTPIIFKHCKCDEATKFRVLQGLSNNTYTLHWSPQMVLQNSFGLADGRYYVNRSITIDNDNKGNDGFGSVTHSIYQNLFNYGQYPNEIEDEIYATQATSGVGQTFTCNYKSPVGTFVGSIVPVLKFKNKIITTGTTITSTTSAWQSLSLTANAIDITSDGVLEFAVIVNSNGNQVNFGDPVWTNI